MSGVQICKERVSFTHELHSLVKAFVKKLLLLSQQVESNTLTHFPTLKEKTPSANKLNRYSAMVKALLGEFSRRFEEDAGSLWTNIHM